MKAIATNGAHVQVDLSGLEIGGLAIGGGIATSGEIVAINPVSHDLTIHLDLSLAGQDELTVSASRAQLLPDA